MLVLVFALTIFAFMFVGSTVFVVCAAYRPFRPRALSAAFWCAVWGPAIVAFEMLAGLSLAADGLAAKHWNALPFALPPMPTWSAYAAVSLVATVIAATAAAWVHQALMNRMTFALFRVYATLVVGGIGSVFGWAWSLWLISVSWPANRWFLSLAGLVLFTSGFGYAAFRWPRHLRGNRPTRLQWVSQSEFDGPSATSTSSDPLRQGNPNL